MVVGSNRENESGLEKIRSGGNERVTDDET
jgi:hypothetical protein